MCGIAGILNLSGLSLENLQGACSEMTTCLAHRGPDDAGVWTDIRGRVALGHRRLSILDLSPLGHQPMISSTGRFVITYNGEVYNYLDIRRKLDRRGEAPAFRGHSDTELMLATIEAWGLERAVQEFNGIFAFAVWDDEEQALFLVRDRIGVKPLYYGWARKSFVFGSELKALKRHPHFDNPIDRQALALFFRHNYIPGPYSIYQGVFKMEPGCIIRIPVQPGPADRWTPLPQKAYWSAREIWSNSSVDARLEDLTDIRQTLENLLVDSVRSQMISDVPIGAFLSGGTDSSLVTAIMQGISSRPVKTFTIGFHEAEYNEAVFAKNVATHLGTDHTELYVTDKQARDIIPLLPTIYDEPFADESQIPTYLVSRLTRERVTVCLSGDGGDELFSGYERYVAFERLWRLVNAQPKVLKRISHAAIHLLPARVLDILGYPLDALFKGLGYGQEKIGRRLKKYVRFFEPGSPLESYREYVSNFSSSANPVPGIREPRTIFSENLDPGNVMDLYQLMSVLDILTYLPDCILVKVDRASMAVALEARVPLLDHRVVEFAASVPTTAKIRNGSGKWILKQILKKFIPVELTDRPKMGFGVPVGEWLRGPLRSWCEDLLNCKETSSESFLEAESVQRLWREHLSREGDRSSQLWAILMFRSWLGAGGKSS